MGHRFPLRSVCDDICIEAKLGWNKARTLHITEPRNCCHRIGIQQCWANLISEKPCSIFVELPILFRNVTQEHSDVRFGRGDMFISEDVAIAGMVT